MSSSATGRRQRERWANKRHEAETTSDIVPDELPEELKDRRLFADIDEQARQSCMQSALTFSKLRDYLSVAIPENTDKPQLYLVRGLLAWLCHARDLLVMGEPGDDTPMGLLTALDTENTDVATAFQTLCKNCDIECELVTGTVRRVVGYEVGDVEQRHNDAWNAVRIDGTWHLIQARWACSAIVDYEAGGWIKKEVDGLAMTEKIEARTGFQMNRFDEDWFCTDPWQFIHYCYPDEQRWQLLPANKQIPRVKDFLLMPLLTEAYFPLGLKLSTEQTCLLTVDGDTKEITFQMAVDKQGVAGVHLTYNLYVREDMKSSTDDITERMVLNWHDGKKNTSSFELRFPVAGTYKLEIDANTYDTDERMTICKFKINCKRATRNFRPLPIHPPHGWGCTHKAAEFGLVKPSWTAPKFPIKATNRRRKTPANVACMKFTIKRDMVDTVDYKTSLHSCDYPATKHAQLQKYVRTDVDNRSMELTVQATVPTDGEFALVIEATCVERGEFSVPVCTYLLTTLERSHAMKIPRNISRSIPQSPSGIAALSKGFSMVTGKRMVDAKAIISSNNEEERTRFMAHLKILLTSEQQEQVAAMIEQLLSQAYAQERND